MRLFRDTLTALAALLALGLIALMVVPPFLDWNAQRGRIAAALSDFLGMEVRIEGDLRLSFLPQPEIDAEGISFGDGARPVFTAQRLTLTASAMALAGGGLRITQARADGVIIALDAVQRLKIPASGEPRRLKAGIDRLDLKQVSLLRAGQKEARADDPLSGLDIGFEAPDLAGPFRLDMVDTARGRDFRAQIGRIEEGRARLKGVLEDKHLATRLTLDGIIGLMGDEHRPLFDGAVQAIGNPVLGEGEKPPQLAIEGNARLLITAGQAIADPVNLTLGSGEQALFLAGKGFADLMPARPVMQAQLAARRFDANAVLKPQKPGEPAFDWGKLAAQAELARQIHLPLDLDLSLAVAQVQIAGSVLADAALRMGVGAQGSVIEEVQARLPGETRFEFRRAPRAGRALLDGRVELESKQPALLMGWLRGVDAPVPALPNLKFSTGLLLSREKLMLPGLFLASEAGALSGSGSLTWPAPASSAPVRLGLELSASRFDARVLSLIDPLRPGAGFDLSTKLSVSHLQLDGAELGGLDLFFERDRLQSSLRHLRLKGRKGEELALSGSISGETTHLTGKLDAEQMADIAQLIRALLPGAVSDAFVKRAPLLSPALALANIRIESKAGEALWDVALDGKLGGTSLKLHSQSSLRDTDLQISLDGEANNEDGTRLIAQIGGTALAAGASLPGRLALKASGNPRRALNGTLKGAVAGIDLDASGTFSPFRQSNPLDGWVKLETGDLSVLHRALGGGAPHIAAGTPMRLDGRFFAERSKITLTGFAAHFGDWPAGGEISFDLARGGQVAGQIRLKQLALAPLLAPVFGRDVKMPVQFDWPKSGWAVPFAPLLSGDLWIEGQEMEVLPSFRLSSPQLVLRFAPDLVSIEGFEAQAGEARYSANLVFARKDKQVEVSGRAGVKRVALPNNLGQLSGEVPFSASGENMAQLVGALGGAGQISLENLRLPEADPQALPRVLAMPLQSLGPVDENRIGALVASEMKKAGYHLGRFDAPVTILGGQIRVGGKPVEPRAEKHKDDVVVTPSFLLDLPRGQLDARLNMRLAVAPAGWRGAIPEVSAGWAGRLGEATGLRRQVQVSSLVNGLLAMAIQRDLERTEAFEADVRERAFFVRRAKAEAFLRKREMEIEAFEKAREEAEAAARLKQIIENSAPRPLELAPKAP